MKKAKGTSLLTALIFSTSCLVIISALSYIMHVRVVSVSAIAKVKNIEIYMDSYIDEFMKEHSFYNSALVETHYENTVYKYKNIIDIEKIKPIYFSGDLFTANAFFEYKAILKVYDKDSGLFLGDKNFEFNTIPTTSFVKYSERLIPLNVPVIDIYNMSSDLKALALNSEAKLNDTHIGYVNSFLEINNNIYLPGTSDNFSLPQELWNDFHIEIGWELTQGNWILYLAMYNKHNIFMTKVSLDNIVNNPTEAISEMAANLQQVANSTDRNFLKLKWYLKKTTNSQIKPYLYAIDVNTSTKTLEYFMNETDNYTTIDVNTMFDDNYLRDNIHILAPKLTNYNEYNNILVFVGNKTTDNFKSVYVFDGSNISNLVGSTVKIRSVSSANKKYIPRLVSIEGSQIIISTQTDNNVSFYEYDYLTKSLTDYSASFTYNYANGSFTAYDLPLPTGAQLVIRENANLEYIRIQNSKGLGNFDAINPQIIYTTDDSYIQNNANECYTGLETDCSDVFSLSNLINIPTG